jgi:hypothetical protein
MNGRRNRLSYQRKSRVCNGRIGFSLSILAAIPFFSQLPVERTPGSLLLLPASNVREPLVVCFGDARQTADVFGVDLDDAD